MLPIETGSNSRDREAAMGDEPKNCLYFLVVPNFNLR